jgi:hypothetical protein
LGKPRKNPTLTWALKVLTYPKPASPTHAVGKPSCISSRTSSPHCLMRSNHGRAIARRCSGCPLSHA